MLSLAQTACQEEYKGYGALIEKGIEKGDFNGNVLVFEKGKTVYQKSSGFANIQDRDSLTHHSIFRLASVSKQFTAMAVMLLQEDGKLQYDQDITDLIPELPYEGITIEHLLHHTSGLPDYVSLMTEHWKPSLAEDDAARFISGNDDIVQMLVEKTPKIHFDPGEKWEYSNTGYVLLATIVERVSKMPFEKFLEQRIFVPTEMSSTSVYKYQKEKDEQMPLRVFGYEKNKDGHKVNDTHFLNFAKGDGGIFSTLEDLLKWDRMLYKNELVSKSTLKKAFTPGVLNSGESTNYGFGWFLENGPNGEKIVHHGGGWVGFATYIYRDISNDSCFIVLTNNSNWDELDRIVEGFKKLLSEKDFEN